jgi:hypothetical protein
MPYGYEPPDDYPTSRGFPADPDYATWLDEPADAARTQGLRHLSRLTMYAAQLSTAAAVGFTALFAHTAHTQAVASPAPVRTSPASPAASPSPTGSAARRTAATPSPSTGPASGTGAAATPAATHTLAPPATAPAPPPPSPAPVQTTSSGTVGG